MIVVMTQIMMQTNSNLSSETSVRNQVLLSSLRKSAKLNGVRCGNNGSSLKREMKLALGIVFPRLRGHP
jgi:hypothetical protein